MAEFNIEGALEYYEKENNITEASKKYCLELGIPYEEKYRLRLSRHVNSNKIDDDLENGTVTETIGYGKDELVSTLSALKSDGTIMNIKEYCKFYNIPVEEVKTYKLVTHSSKGAYYNIASNVIEGKGFEEFCKKLLTEIAEIPNKPKTLKRPQVVDNQQHLLVVDPADLHIGKLCDSYETGEDYNSQIAVQRAREGVEGIIEKAKGFKIDKILFIAGNDILHVDTPKSTTTSGTTVDSDGMWYRGFLIAKELYVELLNRLLEVADVHFLYNPSNHDYQSGFFLADVISTYFKDCKNMTFDTSIAHRKYYKYGNNLIGSSHGDGAKQADLPLLMADESKYWSECKHRYIYGHHVHHKISKDYIGATFETLRSPSGTDSWHSRNGYTGVPKAIEGFIHHVDFGQVARITHMF